MRSQVYDRIREAILSGELPAGSRVSPAALAESLGISTMPVREAIRLLEDDGLVETSARRWSRVATPGVELADELYPLVGLLEGFAVTTAGRPTEAQLRRLRAANRDLRAAGKRGDVVACVTADTRFHSALIERSANRSLHRIIDDIKARMSLLEGTFFRSDHVKTSVDQHDEIIRALTAGELRALAKAIESNWVDSLRTLHETLEPGEELAAAASPSTA